MRAVVLTSSLTGLSPAWAQPGTAETAERVLPLDVLVNGTSAGIWPILERGGQLYAPVEAFQVWRLQVQPGVPPITYKSLPYLPLRAVQDLEGRIDDQQQRLMLKAQASTFAATKLTRELSLGPKPSPAVHALFANYDLNFAYTSTSATSDLGALGEVGWSAPWGVINQTFVGRRLGSSGSKLTRLMTAYRRDFPEHGYTLTVGDAVARPSLLGRSAYFGGLQFGTNFSLAPTLNRQPVPLVAGETAAPSTVQLYVNDVLRQTSNVPAGPFTLDNLPTLTGNGQVTVKVRDILGRETLLTQPFLITSELLAPGLNDWSLELGALRRNFGGENTRYGQAFGTGFWRRGLTTQLTGEARVEASADRQAMGAAAVGALGANWLLRAGAMVSRDTLLGPGKRWILGIDRPAFASNFNLSIEHNSRSYRGLGEDRDLLPVRLQVAAQGNITGRWGTFGIGLATQRRYDLESITTGSLNYSTTLANSWQLNVYYSRAFSGSGGYTVGALLNIPIDKQTVVSSSLQSTAVGNEAYASATHNPLPGERLAWRVLAAHQHGGRAEGGLYYLGQRGQLNADVSVARGQSNLRLGAAGGLVATGARIHALPRFEGGAALVEVPGFSDVGVGLGATVSTHTDADGFAFISRLAPYTANPIRLDPNDLPITAEVESLELDAVPAWRSVARLRFAVRGGRGALLKIHFDDGEPAPPGAKVRIEGDEKEFYVARHGEAYVSGLQAGSRLHLDWRGRSCPLLVTLPPGSADGIPRVGPLHCTGVPR